jgi:hypothetical protein
MFSLSVARITSPELIPSFIKDLLASMLRYPEDQLSIYKCFRDFGSAHGEYIGKVYFTLNYIVCISLIFCHCYNLSFFLNM